MTLLEDYRKGTKQGVHLDEPICSPAKRKRAASPSGLDENHGNQGLLNSQTELP